MPRPYKFPNPYDRSPNEPLVACEPKRIVGLYNQYNSVQAQRLSQRVKDWFEQAALQSGWSQVTWVKDMHENSAGCLLYADVRLLTPADALPSGLDELAGHGEPNSLPELGSPEDEPN